MMDRREVRGARWCGVGALAVALAWAGRPAHAQDDPAPPAATPRPAELPDALDAIGRAGGFNVLLDRRAFPDPGPTPPLPASVPPREAVDLIARAIEADVEELAGGVLVLTQAPRVTIQFTEADVRSVLQLLAAYAGKQVLVTDDAQGRVGTDLVNVEWREALDTFVKEVGVHAAVVGDLVLVTGKPVPQAALAELEWRPPGEGARRVTLALDAGLAAACAELARQAEVRLVAEEGDDPPLGGTLRDLAWSDAVRVLAWLTGRRPVTVGDEARLAVPPRAHLRAARCPAAAFDTLLADCAGVRLVAEPPPEGDVTLGLAGVEPLEALRVVALLRGERLERSEEMVTLVPAPWPALGGLGRRSTSADDGAEASDGPTEDGDGAEEGQAGAETETTPAPTQAEEAAAVRARLDALIDVAASHAGRGRLERVIGTFTELRGVFAEHGAVAFEVFRERLPDYRRRLAGYGEVLLSFELQVAVTEGNALLRAMADAVQAARPAEALAVHERLLAHAERMEQQERAVFGRNAAGLRARGEALAERARRQQRLSGIPLALSAVASFGGDPGRPGAAVINGHVVRAGEPVRDAAGAAIRGVILREVLPGSVKLDYEGEEWTQELR